MAKPLSFLDLPQNIRARVFGFTDLIRECPIDLSHENVMWRVRRSPSCVRRPQDCQFHRWKPLGTWMNGSNMTVCYCPNLPVSLLRVSRQIHAEAIAILYGQNVFKASYIEGCGYTPLTSLSAPAWKFMTSLHISLCKFDEAGASRQIVLEKWAALCAYIARRITPLQLDFSVACSNSVITEPAVAKHVMDPIKGLPELKNCAIRLAWKRDEHLNNVAKHMSLQASGRHTALYDAFPRFNRLPREIRLLILVKTELVVRSNEWEEAEGIRIPTDTPEKLNLNHCCDQCTPSLAICCCQTRGAAYSTTCVCRRIPTPLFYVSRQMSYEATEIFYSHNTFLMDGSITSMISFLHRLSPFALRRLRMIDIRPKYNQFKGWTDGETPHAHDWQSLVSFMRENLSIPNLALSLDLENCVDRNFLLVDDLVDDDESELAWLRDTCTEIVIPLGQLQGLRSFQVMLGRLNDYESVLEEMVLGCRPDRAMVASGGIHVN